jgi:type II secretory pathway component PulM
MNFSMACLVVINSHENKENGGFIMDNVVYENIAIDGAKVPFNKITSWLAPYIERGEYVVSGGFVKYLNAQGVE